MLREILVPILPVLLIMLYAWVGMLLVALASSIIFETIPNVVSKSPPMVKAILEIGLSGVLALIWLLSWHVLTLAYRNARLKG